MTAPADLVLLAEFDPRLRIELRYATAANPTGRVLYGSGEAWLRRATAEKLSRALDTLAARGLGLKVLDAYRPPSVQRALWAVCPDERYVAPPERGSRHTRGTAVDVTLVDAQARDLEMPSAYDEFGVRARRDWVGASPAAQRHVGWLTEAMTGAGFGTIEAEWWHYDDAGWRQYGLLVWEPGAASNGRQG